MELGAFSVSLAVKDLEKSKNFYQTLGFEPFGGDISMNYLIMKNGDTLIGLFQGMFEGNILTFNPGWDCDAQEVNPFTDVRELETALKDSGVELIAETDKTTESGAASIMLQDPDGNMILIDQHR